MPHALSISRGSKNRCMSACVCLPLWPCGRGRERARRRRRVPATARLGGCKPRRPAEPCGGGEARLPGRRRAARQQIGTRVMAWWRARVVAPVRRAWLAVAAARARARNGECGIVSLHQDVQTCGYEDVQVMWNMLSSEKEAAPPPSPPRKRAFWRLPVWPVWSARGRCLRRQREENPTAACNFAM